MGLHQLLACFGARRGLEPTTGGAELATGAPAGGASVVANTKDASAAPSIIPSTVPMDGATGVEDTISVYIEERDSDGQESLDLEAFLLHITRRHGSVEDKSGRGGDESSSGFKGVGANADRRVNGGTLGTAEV
ncbi:hypothetical protein FOA52_011582 [Chlamydomonas sp. UWO 241]|nr:hypothetical protein FOA52_011582 [Chlamydomonas sp. UWO 241]